MTSSAMGWLPPPRAEPPVFLPARTGRLGLLRDGVFLLAALAAYTFCPLLVNWSVMTIPPEGAYTATLTVPAHGGKGLGLVFDDQDGLVFVSLERPNNRAPALRHGDTVAMGVQGEDVAFDLACLRESPALRSAVMAYLEGSRGSRYRRSSPSGPLPPSVPWCRGIDPTRPLVVTFDLGNIVATAGEPHLPASIILCKTAAGAVLFGLFTAAVHGLEYMRTKVLTTRMFALIWLSSFGAALGEVCEILANSKINASVYSMVSQTRLLGTAAFMYFYLGKSQTQLQLSQLASLSLTVFVFYQVPDVVPVGQIWNGFGKARDPLEPVAANRDDRLGLVYAVLKIVCSIVSGVLGQRAFQDPSVRDLPSYAIQAAVFLASALCILPATLVFLFATGWEHGLLGGDDVLFRRCGDFASEEDCLRNAPVHARVAQGWDHRTLTVLAFFIYRDAAVNVVLRRFNAIATNLVNASATLAIYFLSLVVFGIEFNLAKFGLVVCVILQIYMYTAHGRDGAPEDPMFTESELLGMKQAVSPPLSFRAYPAPETELATSILQLKEAFSSPRDVGGVESEGSTAAHSAAP